MIKNSEDIYYGLPDLIRESVTILSIAPTLTELIAEKILKSTGITNGNTLNVISEIKTFPIWIKRNKLNWSIDNNIREIAIKKLNGSGLDIKRKTIKILKEFEPYFNEKSYLELKDFQLQLTRLSLSIPEEQEYSIGKLRTFYDAAEIFNNHDSSRILSKYIEEGLTIRDDIKKIPIYILSAYYINGMHYYRNQDFQKSLKYLIPVWQNHDNSINSIKDAAVASHIVGLIYSKDRNRFADAENAYKQSLQLSQAINNSYGLAHAFHSLGNLYSKYKNRFKDAEDAYNKSLKIEKINNNIYGLGQVYHSLGNLYSKEKNRFNDAEDAYRKSLELRIPANDYYGLAQVYHSLGNLFSKDRFRFKDAENEYYKSIEIELKNNNTYGLAQVYHSLGNLYSKDKNRFKDAENSYLKSLEINHEYHLAQVYHSLGNLYSKDLTRFKDAEKAYNKSLEIEIRNNNTYGLAQVYANFGKLVTSIGDYKQARVLFEKSLKYQKDPKFILIVNNLIRDLPK